MNEIEKAANPTTEEAIKYLERMIFTQDFSASTLRAKAINKMSIEALREKMEREKEQGECVFCYADTEHNPFVSGYKFCPMCGRKLES